MSYCRADGVSSDVYMMATGGGAWFCCGCNIRIQKGYLTNSGPEMLQHLQDHRDAGDKVPERAFERLRREIAAKQRLTRMEIHTVNGYHLAGNDFLTLAINVDDPEDCHWFKPSDDPDLKLTAWERAIAWTSPGA